MSGSSNDPNAAAMAAQREQMARIDAIESPELKEYILQNPELMGMLEAEQLDPSALEDIAIDPRLQGMQMQALEAMQQRAGEGLTQEDKYAMEEALGMSAAQEQSQRAAIEQQMAERGMGDSGQALMMKLQNQQASGNRGRQQAMDMAQQSAQQRQSALANMANAAGQIQGQDFSRQSQVASAKDRIAAANAQNRQGVSAQNLAARQAIENQRASTANLQSGMGNQLAQQRFSNEMARATGQGNVANSMSQIAGNAPQKPGMLQSGLGGAATGASIGSSFGPAGAGYGAAIGAGVGMLGSTFEDGGIAQKPQVDHAGEETKQREQFKKKYMKQIHEEVLRSKAEVTGEKPQYANGGLVNEDAMRRLRSGQMEEGSQRLGIDNDIASSDINTLQAAQDAGTLDKSSTSNISGSDIAKGMGALNQLLGSKPQQRKKIELGDFNMPAPKNVMQAPQAQQFANPYARFEDGGTYCAEDGSLLFTSDGEGDIVEGDNFERDRVDAKLNSGEAVINVAQQQRLMDLLKGKISPDQLGDEDIVEGVPREYSEELNCELEGEGELELEGLQKLLAELGRE